ncbi:MAG TPA: glycosyltransferase family 39 protein [Candidatus Hydrogenedentes bacterium]|nr:glycosyltransferase family 39 protein [Candidatus Hydrogenedentota bacterium]
MMRHWALWLILIAAGALRFWGLPQQGILAVDEGRYVLDAISKYEEVRIYGDLFRARQAERSGGPGFELSKALPMAEAKLREHAPFSPKLLYSYLTAAVMIAMGFKVWACNVVEAVSGLLMILATWAFVRSLAGERAGLVAAGVLAASAYHVYYSRNGYPQTACALFVLMAVLVHWRGERVARATSDRDRVRLVRDIHNGFAGVLAGLSFWVNYQSAGALPLLAAIHLLMSARGGSAIEKLGRFVRGGVAMALGFATVIVVAEIVSYPAILLFRIQGLQYPHGTFLELLAPRFTAQTHVGYNASGLLLFPYFLCLFEGGIWCGTALFLGMAAAVLWKKDREAEGSAAGNYERLVYFAAAAFVPWIIFSVKTMQGARMFLYLLPFVAAWIGVAVSTIWTVRSPRRRARRAATAALLALGACSSLYHVREILAMRSAYPEVIRYAREHQHAPVYAAWSAVLESYLHDSGLNGGALEVGAANDVSTPQLYVSDWQELYYGNYPDQPNPFGKEVKPVAEFEHDFGRIFLETEAFPSYGRTWHSIRWVRGLDLGRARKLLVYDLRQTRLRGPGDDPMGLPELWITFPGKR